MNLFDTARQGVFSLDPSPVVTLYSCGITPYDAAHLGHAFVYLTFDVLQRRLRDQGMETRCVRNVTDVDDDILRKARQLGVHYLDLAAREMARFERDMRLINLHPVYNEPRATGAIAEIVTLVDALVNAGHAYVVDGWVYFNVHSAPSFGHVSHFSREEMRTLRYASLLHDFGKVGVREDVLVKAKKLYPAQHALIRERVTLARRTREVESLQRRLDYLLAHGRDAYLAAVPAFEAAHHEEVARLERARAAVEAANEPSLLPDGRVEQLLEAAAITFPDLDGTARSLLADDEVRLLSLRKGSLSDAERLEIESHVVHSYRFLRQIPWTREIRRIPAIALGHHEKLNGTGYPNRLSGPDIPIQTRMMTIADIFDALSAADRPYKKAVPVERALHILDLAVRDGEIDPTLFALFVEARIFDRWLVEPFAY
ncbi:MAG: hypothetical protein KGN76_13435 [Acidobacteriota bacterium]|nr:hypothetical protein [Acidobacteriota bacterium]